MVLNQESFNIEINRWFQKSIININHHYDINIIQKTLEIFKTDYARYFPSDEFLFLNKIHIRAELQGILLYRLARECFLSKDFLLADSISSLGRFLSGFEIYYSAIVGEGIKINHGLGTVIGARTIIGRNVLIHQGVTFGDKNGGRPIIGDSVVIYAGAKVLGNISVGNHSIIGANAVLLVDVPPFSIAVGNPAKLIK